VGQEEPQETTTGPDGSYAFEDVADGPAKLVIEADGFEPQELELSPGAPVPSQVALTPAVPLGELRGLVRSFAGKPLDATVRVGEEETQTNDEGRFEIELEAGTYEVEIEADGYRSQKRTVQIDENDVFVLNVELRRARR
jgi:hypothetical protein